MCSACHRVCHITCCMCSTCPLCGTGRRLCVSREANSDLFEQIMRPSTSKRTKGSFLVRKRVCNTICGLNGAGQRVRGSSCITTATILQETTVSVCHRSVSNCCFVQVMNDILTPCDPTSIHYKRISDYKQGYVLAL